jgi:DNA primase
MKTNQLVQLAIKNHAEGRFNIACPVCVKAGKNDKKKALYVNRDAGYYRCFRCGLHGSFGSESSADIWLRDSGKIEKPKAAEIALPEEYVTYEWLYNSNDPRLSATRTLALDYANKRGVTRDLAQQYRIGFCLHGPKAGRLIVPIIEGPYAETTYGYVARDYTGWSDYPYLYPKGMSRGIALYNFSELFKDTDEPLLVMEGVLDCIPHMPNSVAVMGMPSNNQIEQLANCIRPVVFALDGDAWQQAEMFAWKLRFLGCTAGAIRLKAKQDPDEISHACIMQMAVQSLG